MSTLDPFDLMTLHLTGEALPALPALAGRAHRIGTLADDDEQRLHAVRSGGDLPEDAREGPESAPGAAIGAEDASTPCQRRRPAGEGPSPAGNWRASDDV